jgi:hypothetical protein
VELVAVNPFGSEVPKTAPEAAQESLPNGANLPRGAGAPSSAPSTPALGTQATAAGQSQARRRRQRLPLPPLASHLAPSPRREPAAAAPPRRSRCFGSAYAPKRSVACPS